MQKELISELFSPLVSFIITTSKHQKEYLVECIKSILQLSLNPKEREIILIDDGSDICPLNDLAEYLPNIIYLRQPNQGVSVARNYGMKIATGKYIQFIDGDDYILKAAYEHCLDIVRYHQPDIVTFNYCKNNKNIEPSYELPTPVTGTDFLNNNNLHGAAWSYIFRHSIVGSLQFTPGIVYGEDEEFTPQLFLRAERIFKINTEAYFYRDNKNSVSHQYHKEKIQLRMDNSMEVLLHLQQLLDKIPVAERQALNRRIAQLTMDYLYNNIRLNHSLISLNKCIKQLRSHGLYPLPDKDYTKKYTMFRKAISTYLGRIGLLLFIKK
ncbi:glycosyltransferase [Prevotella hominis]|uniref:glycosyltransferase n=1 Tax=Segatella hominis TaxID=2518605 RepID=UPI001F2A640E|nr:glycosyltransferase [Segatella hominis]MBS7282815.1 glycosyltransferase [Prevotella sp.]MCF2591439.1 glycosyltransferase [Segatella hominis]